MKSDKFFSKKTNIVICITFIVVFVITVLGLLGLRSLSQFEEKQVYVSDEGVVTPNYVHTKLEGVVCPGTDIVSSCNMDEEEQVYFCGSKDPVDKICGSRWNFSLIDKSGEVLAGINGSFDMRTRCERAITAKGVVQEQLDQKIFDIERLKKMTDKEILVRHPRECDASGKTLSASQTRAKILKQYEEERAKIVDDIMKINKIIEESCK